MISLESSPVCSDITSTASGVVRMMFFLLIQFRGVSMVTSNLAARAMSVRVSLPRSEVMASSALSLIMYLVINILFEIIMDKFRCCDPIRKILRVIILNKKTAALGTQRLLQFMRRTSLNRRKKVYSPVPALPVSGTLPVPATNA